MKKSKATRSVLVVILIISIIAIIILEGTWCEGLRKTIGERILFLSGKRVLFSNIFLGILSSAFCMYIGECVSICILRKTTRIEIRKLADELWPMTHIKPGKGRESYIQNAYKFIRYRSEIEQLYQEYDRKKDTDGRIVELLRQLSIAYRAICEIDTMKNNNYQFYVESLKDLNLNVKEIYKYSQCNKDIMKFREFIEKTINAYDDYKKKMENNIDECIKQIVKIEKYLDESMS